MTAANQPVAGATASIVELGLEARTDSNGAFAFSGIPDGSYTISVRRTGFRPAVVNRVSAAMQLAPIVMVESPVTIGAVTVTASRGATETGSSVLPVSELSEDQLRRDATISLAHSLTKLPGVRSVSTGEQIGKPMIRGFYGSRVLTMQNGSRLEDYSWSEEDAPSVDARLAQRVEVIRGPASVLYGSDAVGGVINVIPQDLPVSAGPGFYRVGGEVYGASNNLETGGALNIEGAKGPVGWRATGVGRFAQSYDTPAGEVGHTGFFSINGDAAAALRGTKSNTTLRFSHYGGEFKLLEARGPGSGSTVEGEQEEGPERKLADDRIQLVNDLFLPKVRLETKAQFQRHSLVEVSDDLCNIDPAACASLPANGPKEQTAFDLLLNTATVDVLAHHSLARNVNGIVGVSGMYQGNDSRGPIFLIPGATTTSGGAFLFEEASFGRLGLAAGARFDARKAKADMNSALGLESETSQDWSEPSANAGIVFHVTPEVSLIANAGLAWRAPTLFELYANGPHLAEGRYEVGDRTLAAEHAKNLDAGLRWRSSRIAAEVNAFSNYIDDYIYIIPTTQTIGGLRVFRHQQTDAKLRGGEAIAQVEIVPAFVVHGRYDYVRGTNEKTDENLPLMPPSRTALGAEYRFPSAAGAFVGVEVENVSRQQHPNPMDIVTAGYSLLNLDAGFNYTLFGRASKIDIGVRNALNREYRSFLSRYKEFALEPGRNLMIRISTMP